MLPGSGNEAKTTCSRGSEFRVSAENVRDVRTSRLPELIFDACERDKLNQNRACQELQIRLKKGPKMASDAISEH